MSSRWWRLRSASAATAAPTGASARRASGVDTSLSVAPAGNRAGNGEVRARGGADRLRGHVERRLGLVGLELDRLRARVVGYAGAVEERELSMPVPEPERVPLFWPSSVYWPPSSAVSTGVLSAGGHAPPSGTSRRWSARRRPD